MLENHEKREILESIQGCNGEPKLLSAYQKVYYGISKEAGDYFKDNQNLESGELNECIHSLSEFANIDFESFEERYEADLIADIRLGRREVIEAR